MIHGLQMYNYCCHYVAAYYRPKYYTALEGALAADACRSLGCWAGMGSRAR